MNIYLNNYYLELPTGLKWKLINIEYNNCELQSKDITCFVTLDELMLYFKRVVICRYCKHFIIKDLKNVYSEIKCGINEENTNIRPCGHFEHK